MQKICGIYKITSPTSKIYIGQSVDIHKRFSSYKKGSCKSQPKLFTSIKKYGWENHLIEIIIECAKENLNELEKKYIFEFNSFDSKNGLNLTTGGQEKKYAKSSIKKLSSKLKGKPSPNKGIKMSDEQKIKIGNANKSKTRSEYFKNNLKEKLKGRILSEETRNKMSVYWKEKSRAPYTEKRKAEKSLMMKGKPRPTKGMKYV